LVEMMVQPGLKSSVVEPSIKIESAPGELRITVPKTERVMKYYKSIIVVRAAAMMVVICVSAAIGLMHRHDIGSDIMCGIFILVFAGALFYYLAHPEQVSLFTASAVILHLDDSALSITKLDEGSTRRYARDQIRRIRTQRCDFSRCGMIVLSERRNGRRLKAIIAVYAELQPLADATEVLRRAMYLDKRELALPSGDIRNT
jgi:hypothetical protein